MKFNDAVIGLFLIASAILMMLYARTFPMVPGQIIGPGAFPIVLGTGMVLCGALLVVKGISSRLRNALVGASILSLGDWIRQPNSRLSVALVLGFTALFFPIAELIGFAPTAMATVFLLTAQMGARWPVAALSAVSVAVGVELLFRRLLLVPLP